MVKRCIIQKRKRKDEILNKNNQHDFNDLIRYRKKIK
jgi:hypothetical protein